MESKPLSEAWEEVSWKLADFSAEVDRSRFSYQVATVTERKLVTELRKTRAALKAALDGRRERDSSKQSMHIQGELTRLRDAFDRSSEAHERAAADWSARERRLHARIDQLAHTRDELKRKVANLTRDESDSTEVARRSETVAQAQKAAADTLRKKLQEATLANEAKEHELSELRARLDAFAETAAETRRALRESAKKASEVEPLKQTVQNLTELRSKSDARCEDLLKENSSLSARLTDLTNTLMDTKREMKAAQSVAADFHRLNQAHKDLLEKHACVEEQLEQLRSEVVDKAAVIQRQDARIVQLSAQASEAQELEEVQAELLKTITFQTQEIKSLQAAAAAAGPSNDRKTSEQDRDVNSAAIQALSARMDALTGQLSALQAWQAGLVSLDAAVAGAKRLQPDSLHILDWYKQPAFLERLPALSDAIGDLARYVGAPEDAGRSGVSEPETGGRPSSDAPDQGETEEASTAEAAELRARVVELVAERDKLVARCSSLQERHDTMEARVQLLETELSARSIVDGADREQSEGQRTFIKTLQGEIDAMRRDHRVAIYGLEEELRDVRDRLRRTEHALCEEQEKARAASRKHASLLAERQAAASLICRQRADAATHIGEDPLSAARALLDGVKFLEAQFRNDDPMRNSEDSR